MNDIIEILQEARKEIKDEFKLSNSYLEKLFLAGEIYAYSDIISLIHNIKELKNGTTMFQHKRTSDYTKVRKAITKESGRNV